MTNYTKVHADWQDGEGGGTPVLAVDLEQIEEGIETAAAEITAHLADGTDAHDASAISVSAAGFNGNLAPTDDTVQKVAQKLDDLVLGSSGDASAHIADTSDAHDASAISVDPTGFNQVDATNMQSALLELDTATTYALFGTSVHIDATADAHNASAISVAASGFNGNLAPTDDTVQKVAQKLDDLTISGGVTDGDKGDVVVASSGTNWTVDDAAVARIVANMSKRFFAKDPAYGAKGDLRQITCSITSGTATLTAASGTFSASDVGKSVVVFKGGASSANLTTTISAYSSSTTVSLAANAGTTVSSGKAIFGTNDTAALNAVIAAVNATTYGGVIDLGAGDFFVPGGSLNAITKPCWLVGSGRSEWYSISESVTKVSTAALTGTLIDLQARSSKIENVTVHNRNYSPDALSVSPGLGGFPVPLPTALIGQLPTAGCGVKATGGDGFALTDVVIAGFYDNLDQYAGVNVVIDKFQSWAPVRYGHRIRNEAWVDAGGTNIDQSFYFGNPKYSQGTTGIKWESGGGLWVTATGFSGMGAPGGGGSQQTGMAYGIHSNFASAGSSNLQVTAGGIEAVEVGVYATKGSSNDFFHIQIEDIQFSPWFVTSGASTYGVFIEGQSGSTIKDVRISGVFTNFPSNAGNAVKLSYVTNAALDLQAGNNGPTTMLSQSNCTNVVNQAVPATTSNAGLLPALGGGTTNFLRADGTWAAPPSGGATVGASAVSKIKRDPAVTTALSANTTISVPFGAEDFDELACHDNTTNNTRITFPTTDYYNVRGFCGAYDTNRLLLEWRLNGTTVISSGTFSSNPSGENWCAGVIETGWRQFSAGDYIEMRATSEDAADIFGNEEAGWISVERRGSGKLLSKIVRSGTQSLAPDTAASVAWAAEDFDEVGCHDNATNNSRITFPATGYYTVDAFVRAVDTNRLLLAWRLNGTTDISSATYTSRPTQEDACAGIVSTGWRYFTAGDYIEVRATSEDAADIGSGESEGWVSVERRV